MAANVAERFARADMGLVVAPAGCGKTHLIAEAVGSSSGKCELILTHTHAGVRSILKKLKDLSVPQSRYRIDTIDGFALRYATYFPVLSGLTVLAPENSSDWGKVRQAAWQVVNSQVGKRILAETYAGVYVDEYQDCSESQHDLVMALAQHLRCRIVGDPLQAIFDFDRVQPSIRWHDHVSPNFVRIASLDIPWRWKSANASLGTWLLDIRERLISGREVDLRGGVRGVFWIGDDQQKRKICSSWRGGSESVVILCQHPQQQHKWAQQTPGYVSMEEVMCNDLLKQAREVDQHVSGDPAIRGFALGLWLIEFASKCMTGMSEMSSIKKQLAKRSCDFRRLKKHLDIANMVAQLVTSTELSTLVMLMEHLPALIAGARLFRSELWYDMIRALRLRLDRDDVSIHECAWEIRDRGRDGRRTLPSHVVSRVRLVKGLEFDRVLVINPERLNAKELYVALTRGARELCIASMHPTLIRDPVPDTEI